eukprot:4759016-Amphidinium_carterae.2
MHPPVARMVLVMLAWQCTNLPCHQSPNRKAEDENQHDKDGCCNNGRLDCAPCKGKLHGVNTA